jgi:hypothetical protein
MEGSSCDAGRTVFTTNQTLHARVAGTWAGGVAHMRVGSEFGLTHQIWMCMEGFSYAGTMLGDSRCRGLRSRQRRRGRKRIANRGRS